MLTKELLDYVKSESAKGTSADTIKQKLQTQGWTVADAAEAVTMVEATPKPQAPDPLNPKIKPQGSVLKPRRKRTWLAVLVVIILVLAGGGTAYGYLTGYFVSLETIASQSIAAAHSTNSAAVDATLTYDVSTLSDNSHGGLFSGSPVSLSKGSITIKGTYDVSVTDMPRLDATITTRAGSFEGAAELRIINKTLYGELTDVPAIAEMSGLSAYANQWYSFDYGSESLPDNLPFVPTIDMDSFILNSLTPDQKAHLTEMAAGAHFITVTKRMLPETIDGVLAYHFTFDLDRAGITQYTSDVTNYLHSIDTDDSYLSSVDLSGITDELNLISNFNGEAWIGINNHLPYKVNINFDGQESQTETTHFAKIGIVATFSGWNAPMTIAEPSDATSVDGILQQARNEQTDAQTRAELSSMRAQAELYYDNNGNSYKGFCASSDAQQLLSSLTGTTCRDSATYYIVYAGLTDGTFACSDSKGTLGIAKTADKGRTCPAPLPTP